ncbi:S41 family peptidase [candidate division KSB1 bacterium]|nr:S41 family peptidase [candidate division KSB1 bacterium]
MDKKYRLILVTLLVLILTSLAFRWVIFANAPNRDYYFNIQKNQDLFGRIYEEIVLNYVEEVDPNKFIRAGINGMLRELDPYTVFIEQEDSDELHIRTKGKYGGIGLRIIQRENYPTVIEPPMSDTPAERAGIIEGDQIIAVDGKSMKNMSVSEVAKQLRGEPGTKITIKVRRGSEPEPIEFHLIRAIITVKDITYKDLIKDEIGYIQLSNFSKDAGKEMQQALRELKNRGMKGLVLDLRGNPGGLLEAAIEVTESFVAKDQVIVTTKGRIKSANKSYISQMPPIWEGPLVVLVDGASASASEIASGAIQDLDRGLILGTQTYGKGLVQTLLPRVSENADLKITTAKYFIPSGRLIQKKDYFSEQKNGIFAAEDDSTQSDSSKNADNDEKKKPLTAFKTRNGRTVYEGGGITPDITIKGHEYNSYQIALERKSMIFGFAVAYFSKHSDLKPDFEVTESMLNEFRAYLEEKKFDYNPTGFSYLDRFEKSIKEEGNLEAVNTHLQAIRQLITENKKSAFDQNIDYIRKNLKVELAAKMGGYKAKVETTAQSDPVLSRAIEILKNTNQYTEILTGNQIKEARK